MKVYEMMTDYLRMEKRVAVFSSKAKAVGFLIAILMDDSRAYVKMKDGRSLYGRDARKVTIRNLLDCKVVCWKTSKTYYVNEVEVL